MRSACFVSGAFYLGAVLLAAALPFCLWRSNWEGAERAGRGCGGKRWRRGACALTATGLQGQAGCLPYERAL